MIKKDRLTLDKTHVDLCREWHPTKNTLEPSDVTYGSGLTVWWLLPYDDPRTGKHFVFEWQARIRGRVAGNGCPFLTGKAVWTGYNDLATLRPDLVQELHPTKNGDLDPSGIYVGSTQKVWWLLPYDDPNTGKHFDFEWQATIGDRNMGSGCPYLSNAVWTGYNDLATTHPHLVAEFHPTKNGALSPYNISANSKCKIWWILPYDDPKTGKHFNFEWQTSPYNRSQGKGCPYLSNKAIWIGYNDLATVNPELTLEWDFEQNGMFKPTAMTCGSEKKVFWRCNKGHSWQASPYNRHFNKSGCPHCIKELRTSFPEQIIYYYVKTVFQDAISGERTILNGCEIDVYIPSIKVGIEYDGALWHQDVERDCRKNDLANNLGVVLIHVREDGCPPLGRDDILVIDKIASQREKDMPEVLEKIFNILGVSVDVNINRDLKEIQSLINFTEKENSLSKKYPEIAKEWHVEKNGNLTPDCVSAHSSRIVWWLLPYDDPVSGKHFDFEWQMTVCDRTKGGMGCPYLSGHRVWAGFNDLSTLNSELASQWNYDKNKKLTNKRGDDIATPDKVMPGSCQKVWWKCINGHEWQSVIYKRAILGYGCPEFRTNRTKSKSLDTSDPAA